MAARQRPVHRSSLHCRELGPLSGTRAASLLMLLAMCSSRREISISGQWGIRPFSVTPFRLIRMVPPVDRRIASTNSGPFVGCGTVCQIGCRLHHCVPHHSSRTCGIRPRPAPLLVQSAASLQRFALVVTRRGRSPPDSQVSGGIRRDPRRGAPSDNCTKLFRPTTHLGILLCDAAGSASDSLDTYSRSRGTRSCQTSP